MSIIKQAKAAQANVTPVVVAEPKVKAKSHAAYGFINGYLVDALGNRFTPNTGVKVMNKDKNDSIEKFFNVLSQLDEVELNDWFTSRDYKFEFKVYQGNLSKSLASVDTLTETEFVAKFEGGMLDASAIRALYSKLHTNSDEVAKYIDVLKFGGKMTRQGNPLDVFKAPSHSVLEAELDKQSSLIAAIEAMASFKEGETYTFVPTSVVLVDKSNTPEMSDDDLGL